MALVPASNATPRLRGAVFGLGMIGRHHARLLQQMDGVEFAGAVDPGGDRFGVVHEPSRIFGSAAQLLASGPLDFAVVAVPTEEHLPVTRELAAAGIHPGHPSLYGPNGPPPQPSTAAGPRRPHEERDDG